MPTTKFMVAFFNTGTLSSWIFHYISSGNLFGAGKTGKQKLAELTGKNEKSSWQVAGFLDNQPEKHLTRIQGVPVYRLEGLRILEGEENYSILITMKDENEIRKQLEQLGLKSYICGELS